MKYDIESIKKRKSIQNRIKKIIFIFIIIMLYNIILLSMSYINKFETPNKYIYKAYVITTNSMSPQIKKDDIIIIKKCKESDLKEGDIITFKLNGEVITHRIIDIEIQNGITQYITKGDNNNIEDFENILFEDIEGIKVITIPHFGKAINILKSGIVLILIILIILIVYLNKIDAKEKSETRREKKKIEDEKFLDK